MKRFILVYGDSASGHLKRVKIASVVRALQVDLVGELTPPAPDIVSFYQERHRLRQNHEDTWSFETGVQIEAIFDEAETFDRFELWFGPHPNSQLALAQTISAIAHRPNLVAKTVLVPLSEDIGGKKPDWFGTQTFDYLPIGAMIADAEAAWSAWCAPTPVEWRALMDKPRALPNLAPVIPRLLAELPDSVTGLSLTQSRILRLIITGGATRPIDIFGAWEPLHGDPAYSYWSFGQLLLDMFHGPTPLLLGTTEMRFSMDNLHNDQSRFSAFMKGGIALTPFGRDVLDGKADYAAVAPIDRHWGGTHLTPDNLWRWNTTAGTLIAP